MVCLFYAGKVGLAEAESISPGSKLDNFIVHHSRTPINMGDFRCESDRCFYHIFLCCFSNHYFYAVENEHGSFVFQSIKIAVENLVSSIRIHLYLFIYFRCRLSNLLLIMVDIGWRLKI